MDIHILSYHNHYLKYDFTAARQSCRAPEHPAKTTREDGGDGDDDGNGEVDVDDVVVVARRGWGHSDSRVARNRHRWCWQFSVSGVASRGAPRDRQQNDSEATSGRSLNVSWCRRRGKITPMAAEGLRAPPRAAKGL